MSTSFASFQGYTFDFRERLREAATTHLRELEASIVRDGFDWLEGYLDNIEAQGSRGNIADLIKTPSRTQTVKKTRAIATAAKDRTNKVKDLNSRLALSPLANSVNSPRQVFSPLLPRSLNVSSVPASPLGDKSKAKGKDKIKSTSSKGSKAASTGAPKAKRGRSKKVVDAPAVDTVAESEAVQESQSAPARLGTAKVDTAPEEVEEEEEIVEKPTKKSRSAPSRVPESIKSKSKADAKEIVEDHGSSSSVLSKKAAPTIVAFDSPPPARDSRRSESLELPDISGMHDDDMDADELDDDDNDEVILSTSQSARPAPSFKADTDTDSKETSSSSRQEQSATLPTTTTAQNALPPPVPALPPVPVRQVRSSWLSKALGTGTVPISGLPSTSADSGPSTFRKSHAPGVGASRPSTQLEYGALRKSLVPAGGLKRKSDVGVDDDDEDDDSHKKQQLGENKKAKTQSTVPATIAKVATVEVQEPAAAQLPRKSVFSAPQRPANAANNSTPKTTELAGVTRSEVQQPTNQLAQSTAQPTSTSSDKHRSDIHKVTKALEEMRERAAAKQKVISGPTLAPQPGSNGTPTGRPGPPQLATSTGTGFLRGIGNIGAGLGRSLGLGGGAKNEEEAAARLIREMEEDKRAQEEAEAELARLMKEMEEEQEKNEREEEQRTTGAANVEASSAPRSTTPPVVVTISTTAEEAMDEDEEQDEDEDEVNESIQLPDLPVPDLHDDPDAEGPDHNIASAIGLAGFDIDFPTSTTPTNTPPRKAAPAVQVHREVLVQKQHQQAGSLATKDGKLGPAVKTNANVDKHDGDIAMVADEQDEQDELDDDDTMPRIPLSSSSANLLSQANMIASKTLGIKPNPGPVKSVQQATAALKKEQTAAERKMQLDKLSEQRRQEAAKRKAEEERARQDEEKRVKLAEEAERKRRVAENIQRKKERDERMAKNHRERAMREEKEREVAAAKAKAAEEEAAKKRKLAAAMLNKSGSTNPIKKPTQSTGPSTLTQSVKGKEPFRPVPTNTKPLTMSTGPSSSTIPPRVPTALGPSTFHTAQNTEVHTTHSSTISLVSATGGQQAQNGERRPLGPPTRPSVMNAAAQHGAAPVRPSNVAGPSQASAVLQQSRLVLQTHLDDKANEVASEDIVLPDIASEYSNSDDESDEDDFKRPAWAESPELRHALEQQAYVNPDELFGPIRPLNMEELFKARAGKFRARTSSGNWHSGDGLSKQEEREYARRMGFKPIAPSTLGSSSATASGSGTKPANGQHQTQR